MPIIDTELKLIAAAATLGVRFFELLNVEKGAKGEVTEVHFSPASTQTKNCDSFFRWSLAPDNLMH